MDEPTKCVVRRVQWETIQPCLPAQRPWSGRPRRDHRQVVEGIIYRYRCGIAWRDLPADFGPWQTVWKRHRAWSADGTWDRILDALLVRADADGELDWSVAVDSTTCRAHQHGTNLTRTTGGIVEPQESSPRAD
ncbi:IS5 family transposase [uncultured Corynebacterium sp.]|uniref:IS5 family transposase n=1 Tax=uncultured Corynebacterium sp. TaxID=159447 RepID=UPI00259464F8|nr:IS5 family transposase [uncultured Corynebacterium sp.]